METMGDSLDASLIESTQRLDTSPCLVEITAPSPKVGSMCQTDKPKWNRLVAELPVKEC